MPPYPAPPHPATLGDVVALSATPGALDAATPGRDQTPWTRALLLDAHTAGQVTPPLAEWLLRPLTDQQRDFLIGEPHPMYPLLALSMQYPVVKDHALRHLAAERADVLRRQLLIEGHTPSTARTWQTALRTWPLETLQTLRREIQDLRQWVGRHRLNRTRAPSGVALPPAGLARLQALAPEDLLFFSSSGPARWDHVYVCGDALVIPLIATHELILPGDERYSFATVEVDLLVKAAAPNRALHSHQDLPPGQLSLLWSTRVPSGWRALTSRGPGQQRVLTAYPGEGEWALQSATRPGKRPGRPKTETVRGERYWRVPWPLNSR